MYTVGHEKVNANFFEIMTSSSCPLRSKVRKSMDLWSLNLESMERAVNLFDIQRLQYGLFWSREFFELNLGDFIGHGIN